MGDSRGQVEHIQLAIALMYWLSYRYCHFGVTCSYVTSLSTLCPSVLLVFVTVAYTARFSSVETLGWLDHCCGSVTLAV